MLDSSEELGALRLLLKWQNCRLKSNKSSKLLFLRKKQNSKKLRLQRFNNKLSDLFLFNKFKFKKRLRCLL